MRPRISFAIITGGLAAAIALGGCGGSSGKGDSDGQAGKTSGAKAEAQQFLDELDAAEREGNADVRMARLNPAVIARYGEDQCRTFIAGQQDKARRHKVQRVGQARPYEYATDNLTATIPDTLPVFAKETATSNNKKKTGERNLNLARVNGQLTYFIDCGRPVAQQ
jgi:hypothetical protein